MSIETEYVVIILSAVIGAAGTLIANKISSKPNEEDASTNRLNMILTYYEKISEQWKKRCETLEKRNSVLCETNDRLRKENKELEKTIRQLERKLNERG